MTSLKISPVKRVRRVQRLGLNPIIATVFLIIAAVVVGAMFLGWQMGWFKSTARTADVAVTADIVSASGSQKVIVTIKNIGTVKVTIDSVKVGHDNEAQMELVKTSTVIESEVGKSYLNPGESISVVFDGGDYQVDTNGDGTPDTTVTVKWTAGKSYLITVTFKDDLGNVLVKTISVQA